MSHSLTCFPLPSPHGVAPPLALPTHHAVALPPDFPGSHGLAPPPVLPGSHNLASSADLPGSYGLARRTTCFRLSQSLTTEGRPEPEEAGAAPPATLATPSPEATEESSAN